MSSPIMPPPPPIVPAKKKGLSPLAWVGIGCGCLILATVLALTVAGAYFVNMAKGFLGKVERNPALAAAELIVRANPDLEKVAVDEAAGTMTIRNKKDGKVLTLSFDDIQNGRFSIEEEGGEQVTFSAKGDAAKGGLTIESGKGRIVVGSGAGADDAPAWLPRYPGASVEGHMAVDSPDGKGGTLTLRTGDDVAAVFDFFKRELGGLGLKVTTTRVDGADGAAGSVSGESDRRHVAVLIGRDEQGTQAIVTYSEKP